jgi:hypothetical protein
MYIDETGKQHGAGRPPRKYANKPTPWRSGNPPGRRPKKPTGDRQAAVLRRIGEIFLSGQVVRRRRR